MTPYAKIRGLVILILFLVGQMFNQLAQEHAGGKNSLRDVMNGCDLAILTDDTADDQHTSMNAVMPHCADRLVYGSFEQIILKSAIVSPKHVPSLTRLFAKYRVYRI